MRASVSSDRTAQDDSKTSLMKSFKLRLSDQPSSIERLNRRIGQFHEFGMQGEKVRWNDLGHENPHQFLFLQKAGVICGACSKTRAARTVAPLPPVLCCSAEEESLASCGDTFAGDWP